MPPTLKANDKPDQRREANARPVSKSLLALEFTLLFIALPVTLFFLPARIPPLPLLWLVALYCLVALLLDPTFERRGLWNSAPLKSSLFSVVAVFAVIAVLLTESVYFLAPQLLFEFIRRTPLLWAFAMLFYPLFSVYPQSIVYRAFLMHRYQPLAGSPTALIVMGAAAFGLMHILFRNPIAVAFTSIGGLLFAWRYHSTRSLAVSALEHALYGCFLFTVGLGQFFFAQFV